MLKTKQQAVEHATKTLELEGFSFSIEEKGILAQVASGEMSTEERREYALSKITKIPIAKDNILAIGIFKQRTYPK